MMFIGKNAEYIAEYDDERSIIVMTPQPEFEGDPYAIKPARFVPSRTNTYRTHLARKIADFVEAL